MNDWLDLGLSSGAGALVSEALKLLIKEAKRVKDFKPLSRDLASTMALFIPLTEMIDSSRDKLDFNAEELKELKDAMCRAKDVVHKCQGRFWWIKKRNLTIEIQGINKDMLKFSQTTLQLLLYKDGLNLTVSVDGISQRMDHLTVSVDGISQRLDHLSVPAPPVPVYVDLCSVPKLNIVPPVGLNLPLMDLKLKLINGSEPRLVVSAPPGYGKTTLVTQLCHDGDIKNEFNNIFFSVVSSTPNFRVIVQNLLQHNGHATRTFENDSQAVDAFSNLLEKLNENSKKTLLVLDDVWQGAELLLLKLFPVNLPDFKILVTSRFDLPGIGPTYKLKLLKDEDAKTLLIQWASRPDGASPAEYEDLLQKILKRCKGYPIVIEVVGVSLKGRSLNSWNSKVEVWFKGDPILDNRTVEECLQPSFDALNPNLKECFLDMGAFLEDQKIRASVIVDIWVELYGKSSIVFMNYLEELVSQNLLKIVPLGSNKLEDGFYNEFLVTQHDLLRELAIRQNESEPCLEKKSFNMKIRDDTFPDWCSNPRNLERKRLNLEIRGDTFPDWCLNLRNPTINASLLSISTDDYFSSSWVELDCSNVEALVLNLSSLDYALPSFIVKMKKLKVLIVNNHGFYPARLSNFSCLSSLPNLKRIRLEKVIITSLDIPQLQLSSLKKLSLVMCSFGEVFYDAEDVLISKALSSLEEIDIDYCYDLEELPYWIAEVDSLKTLSITNCNKLSKLPEAIGNMSKLEMLRLYSCINLPELPETIERLSNLQFLDISHCLGLSKLPQEIGKLQNLKKISMKKCSKCELPDSMIYLESLVVKCDEETGFSWKRFKPKMRNLRVDEEETEHNLNLLHMS